MSNALPLSMSNVNVPVAPSSRTRPTVHLGAVSAANRALGSVARPLPVMEPALPSRPSVVPVAPTPRLTPIPPATPRTLSQRMATARDRIRTAAESGIRIRSYEVALDLDMSEFHFARQFRAAFGRSPHVYYDEVRAERARAFLREGLSDGEVARRVGFRRPAELRSLLNKRFDAE